jgi:hypothetical protein
MRCGFQSRLSVLLLFADMKEWENLLMNEGQKSG